MIYLVRRRKLGSGSCKGIVRQSRTGIQVFRNDAVLPRADMVFRWGCTSEVPANTIVNSASAIHLTNEKLTFRQRLQEEELCPMTWFNESEVRYPCIVRPPRHSQGRRLFKANNPNELRAAIARCPGGFYASDFIDKVREYRVFVCQGRAVWVTNKIPGNTNDIAWNVARGGRFENIRWEEWPLKAVKTAIEAHRVSGLDFSGVDVMEDREGEMYVLEINAAPSQTSEYRQGCVAKAFDWIVRNGKEVIPMTEEKGGYRKFIHPALADNAILVSPAR